MVEKSDTSWSDGSENDSGQRSSPIAASASGSSPSAARDGASRKSITAEEFDRRFDDGEDISEFLDWSSIRRPGLEPKRVNVDFPTWMVERLDREAQKRGVTRQALIKLWLADRLEAVG